MLIFYLFHLKQTVSCIFDLTLFSNSIFTCTNCQSFITFYSIFDLFEIFSQSTLLYKVRTFLYFILHQTLIFNSAIRMTLFHSLAHYILG